MNLVVWCVLGVIGCCALEWLIDFVSGSQQKENVHEEWREDYDLFKDDADAIVLTYSQFYSYYSLNPDAWRLQNSYAQRRKEYVTKEELDHYDDLCNQYGPKRVAQIFSNPRRLFYFITFATFEDYCKYRQFKIDEEERIRFDKEQKRIQKEMAHKKELTASFLESIQHDIDDMRKLSQDEYNQALDTVARIQSQAVQSASTSGV